MTACRLLLLLWLALTGMLTNARAQQDSGDHIIRIRHLTNADGLVNDAVQCGVQDRQGFVWLGMRDGLQRYDGEEFRLFTKEKSGLQANYIAHLACAADGRLWITYARPGFMATGRIVDLLDPVTGNVLPFGRAFGSQRPPIVQEDIFYCTANPWGDVFIITHTGDIWLYRRSRFRKLYSYPNRLMYTISRDAGLWLATRDGHTIRLDTNGAHREIRHPAGDAVFPVARHAHDGVLLMAVPDQPGTVPTFLSADSSGNLVPSAFNPYRDFRGGSDYNYLFQHAHNNKLGYGVCYQSRTEGMLLLPGDGQQPIRLMDSGAMDAIDRAALNDYFTDATGQHWLCTERGIYLVRIQRSDFRRYLDRAQIDSRAPKANEVLGLASRPDGTVVAATYWGVYELSDRHHAKRILTGKGITVLYADGPHLWTAMADSLLDLNSNLRRSVPAVTGDPTEGIRALYRASDGRLYAGGAHGIYDTETMPWKKLDGTAGSNGTCTQLFESRDGRFWAATTAGLLQIAGGRVESRYAADAADAAYRLPCNSIRQVYEDAHGDFWMCTNGDGLVHWQRRTGAARRYTVADGLSSNMLCGLLADGQGGLWISSAQGLMRFQPATGSVRTYTTRDGLADNSFSPVSYQRGTNGLLYFGGANGLVAFRPGDLNNAPGAAYQPRLQVTGFFLQEARDHFYREQPVTSLTTAGITFRPGSDEFYILHFRLLDFEVGRHRYAYRIEGLEKQWNDVSEGTLRLGNLPYGDYVLHIRGQRANGEWSTDELAIPLQVPPPFYVRAWFLALSATVLAGLIALLVRQRTRALRRRNELLESTVHQRTAQLNEMLEEKDVLMKEIHHRVKNNLQVISALLQMQGKRTPDTHTRSALLESQNRVLSIAFIHQNLYQHHDLKTVEMRTFVAELASHLAGIYALPGRAVAVTHQVDHLSLDIDIAVPLGLILNELLTNSYKYAFNGRSAGAVSIVLQSDGTDTCRLQYTDDGPGLPPEFDAAKSKSLGMTLVNDLCRQLEGRPQYQAPPGFGLSLTFPCQTTH